MSRYVSEDGVWFGPSVVEGTQDFRPAVGEGEAPFGGAVTECPSVGTDLTSPTHWSVSDTHREPEEVLRAKSPGHSTGVVSGSGRRESSPWVTTGTGGC